MRMRAYMLLMCFVVSLSPQMDMSVLTELWRLTDPTEPRFCVAVIAIIFNPFFWNVVIFELLMISTACVSALMALGSVFVISSFMALGVTGTFLENISIMNISYWPSNLNFLILLNASPIGVILTAVVDLSYKVAIAFEGHQKAMQV
uniref:Uncharacterized protein n=1 Tax=Sinocyclocheilus rhinocerous TaxID=307959 RepID=A0A673J842_9TELE